jgi:hypothetical protein
MAKKGVLSRPEYDIDEHDDVDAIAYAWRRRAIEGRKDSREGLLASLAHVARYEDEAFDSVVVDPEFVDSFADRKWTKGRAIVEQARDELLRWTRGSDLGKQQRAYYALIRFSGPESELVGEALGGGTAAQTAAIFALTDPIAREDDRGDAPAPLFQTLPGALVELVRPLLRPAALEKRLKAEDSWRDFGRLVELLLRIPSEKVPEILVEALETDELRGAIVEGLARASARGVRLAEISPTVRARYGRAIDVIAKSRSAGLPNRVEMAVAGAIALLVGRDQEMARRTLEVFDLMPGFKAASPAAITPFADLLAASIDLLSPDEIAKLASFMMLDPPERLVATAAAWVRLNAARAVELARRFNAGDRATSERRWQAIARAHMAWTGRQAAIAALIPEGALAAAAKDAPREIALPLFESMIRKARNPAELLTALEGPAARGEHAVLRAVLEKLRDTPFRVDAKVEALLSRLISEDDDDLVQNEIDGENPFRDRREALERARRAAKQGSARPVR